MRIFFAALLLFGTFRNKAGAENASYSLVFVYIGENIVEYLDYTIPQARLFNKNCNIFLIANDLAINKHAKTINRLKKLNVQIVKCEELKISEAHKRFEEKCAMHSTSDALTGYWRYTTERLFYIDELMNQYNLNDVFQIECDVMVYFDISQYLPLLHAYYPGIAAPFENDYVASMSFLYFSAPSAIGDLVQFIPDQLDGQVIENDMYLIASYKNARTDREIDHLPTISKDYIRNWPLKSVRGDISSRSWKYWNHIEKWDSFFDHDGLGQLLVDKEWPGKQTIFDPAPYFFTWERDLEGRKVPYAYYYYNKNKYRVNTIHVPHAPLKNFDQFTPTGSGNNSEWRGPKWNS